MKNQDEIVSSYIEKIEQENKKLKEQLKSKPKFILFETGWWRYNSDMVIFAFFFSLAAFTIGFCIWKAINYVDTGEFYVETSHNKGEFCVWKKFDWKTDDRIDCWDDANIAYEQAAKHRKEWKKLKTLNENQYE